MKKLLLLAMNVCSFTLCAQNAVGVNTQNPLGLFHIDGAGDNRVDATAAEKAIQYANDVVVNEKGNLGVGVVDPQRKLHIVDDSGTPLRIESFERAYQPGLLLTSTNAQGV